MYSNDLTVLTVSYLHAKHILLHQRLISKLNDGIDFPWLIVQNSPSEEPELQGQRSISIIPGVEWDHLPVKHISVHHGFALNKGLESVASRFLLVLDPDFYIFKPDWVEAVPKMMEKEGLSFFGSPWHPQSTSKPRYFPAPHCFFVDLSKVDIGTLNFVPTLGSEKIANRHSTAPTQKIARFLKRQLPSHIQSRFKIGKGSDTGELIHKKYAGDESRYRALQPIFNPATAILRHSGKPVDARFYDRALDSLLPDRLSYIPKKKSYFTRDVPSEFRALVKTVEDCECFVLDGEGFGIHHRGCLPAEKDREQLYEEFRIILQEEYQL